MSSACRCMGVCLVTSFMLVACGSDGASEGPVNVDYSALRIAEPSDMPLVYARSAEEILDPLRNGIRVSLRDGFASDPLTLVGATPTTFADQPYSGTTVQVTGVDEGDLVKYDGQYLYAMSLESVPSASPPRLQNVLNIARTDATTATVEPVSTFAIDASPFDSPIMYRLPTADGRTDSIAVLTQDVRGWGIPQVPTLSLVALPDSTTIRLLDVSDPSHVSQAWQLEIAGWLGASRMIGDTLYLVNNYRPRLPGLQFPAGKLPEREANERLIRDTTAIQLLPTYSENGGAQQPLVQPERCLVSQTRSGRDGYKDLVTITAINLRTRSITDVNCLSTNVHGVYVSQQSLYVAGVRSYAIGGNPVTVLHKFALSQGRIDYRASGSVTGTIAWNSPAYFMDEHEGDLRIVTTTRLDSAREHKLTVMRESGGQRLLLVSTLPNADHPEPIGETGERIYAVRFVGDRAYVVTFRVVDPLYVIDLANPEDPVIAGELKLPGYSTCLQQLGDPQLGLLLAVGQDVSPDSRPGGVALQLFDVKDISQPRLIGREILGHTGSWSNAVGDPHALTVLDVSGTGKRYRVALPVHVFDTEDPTNEGRYLWTYSGQHLFEIDAGETSEPELHYQGALKLDERTDENTQLTLTPNRSVLHGDSVFAVQGSRVVPDLWPNVTVQ